MNLYRLEKMKIRLSTYRRAVLGIFVSLLAMGVLCLFLGVAVPKFPCISMEWRRICFLPVGAGYSRFQQP